MKAAAPGLVLLAWISLGNSQDFPAAWQAYSRSNLELQEARQKFQVLQARQHQLQNQVTGLQAGRTWLTGWITDWRIAAVTDRQVVIADSLAHLRAGIALLERRNDENFQTLYTQYHRILMDSTRRDPWTPADKYTALELGNWLLPRKLQGRDFPDYGTLVEREFENAAVKQLVYRDLQSVLATQISRLEAQIREHQKTRDLARRLTRFQRDLNLQYETDRDPGRSSAFGRETASYTDLGPGAVKEEQTSYGLSGRNPEISTRTLSNPGGTLGTEKEQPGFEIGSVEQEIRLLQAKSRQYRQLLARLEQELRQ